MRIAQVSPLEESVPPQRYGGTERIVHWLSEELVRQGHEVTLYASGDSETSARLVPCSREALRRQRASAPESLALHVTMVDRVAADAAEYDAVHWHIDHLPLLVSGHMDAPSLTTLHGRLDVPNLWPSFRRFAHHPFVALSNAQRAPMPWLRFCGTVPHGMPTDLYDFSPSGRGYLLFLGRISPEKRCDRAIEIATRAGRPLVIAAKVDGADVDYFEQRIKPMLGRAGVEFIGEVGQDDKRRLLAGADALLFPIDWPEPFGLVMIEALASGTPVIAWPHGSVPEVIEDGKSGRIVGSVEEAVAAVDNLDALSRSACRAAFERRFRVERMADDYLHLYRSLLQMEPVHDLLAGAKRGRDAENGPFLSGSAGV